MGDGVGVGEGSWRRPQASPRVTGDFPPALGAWGSRGHKVTAPLPPCGTPPWAFSVHFLRSPGTPPHSLSFRPALPPPTLGISVPALLWLTKGDLGQADTLRPLNSERERISHPEDKEMQVLSQSQPPQQPIQFRAGGRQRGGHQSLGVAGTLPTRLTVGLKDGSPHPAGCSPTASPRRSGAGTRPLLWGVQGRGRESRAPRW